MTILGLRVFSPELASVWTDSECLSLDDGRHSRHRNKLVVSGAGIATIAGGWSDLAAEADHVTCAARDIDHAARLLPEKMRQRCMKVIRGQNRDPREAAAQVALMVGWSPMYGRVIGYRFSGPAFFEPVLVTGECQPDVPEFTRLREPIGEHVVRIARAQLEALRVDYPHASGGMLTMAIVQPGSVVTRSLYDLSADAPLWTPGLIEAPILEEQAA